MSVERIQNLVDALAERLGRAVVAVTGTCAWSP